MTSILTDSGRNRCRKVQDRLIARIDRLWGDDSDIGNVKLGLTGPTVEEVRRLIFPELVDTFHEMTVEGLCLSYDRIAYIPEM